MENQYKSILKATSIFGGTQVIQILVNLLRSKFVALLIGTVGMGMNSLYLSPLTIFISVFGLGLNMSVVKDLSKAYDQKNQERYTKVLTTFRHALLLMGLAGTVVVIASSPLLSRWGFKDGSQTFNYAVLSLLLFFQLQQQGNTAVLVSSRRIKDTAKCTLYGSIISLIIAVPLFYFFGLNGIVPGIVLSSFGNYMVSWFFARKIRIEKIVIPIKEQWQIAKPLLGLGIAFIIGGFTNELVNYFTNLSIKRIGGEQGIVDLGLYSAGFAITLQAIQLVFSSMGSDYYPRLSASIGDKERMNRTINEQTEIVLLLAVPLLSVFMLVSPLLIRVLLSDEFLPITFFVRVLCLGMLLRAISYALGYISFAHGDKKVYLMIESLFAPFTKLVLSVAMYYTWGLTGLGWSFVISYVLYYVVVLLVVIRRYYYRQSEVARRLSLISVVIMSALLALSYINNNNIYYSTAGILTIIVSAYYLYELNKKTNLLESIKSRIQR